MWQKYDLKVNFVRISQVSQVDWIQPKIGRNGLWNAWLLFRTSHTLLLKNQDIGQKTGIRVLISVSHYTMIDRSICVLTWQNKHFLLLHWWFIRCQLHIHELKLLKPIPTTFMAKLAQKGREKTRHVSWSLSVLCSAVRRYEDKCFFAQWAEPTKLLRTRENDERRGFAAHQWRDVLKVAINHLWPFFLFVTNCSCNHLRIEAKPHFIF